MFRFCPIVVIIIVILILIVIEILIVILIGNSKSSSISNKGISRFLCRAILPFAIVGVGFRVQGLGMGLSSCPGF